LLVLFYCSVILSFVPVDPDPPDVVAIKDLVKEKSEELGRETWKYTITWNVSFYRMINRVM